MINDDLKNKKKLQSNSAMIDTTVEFCRRTSTNHYRKKQKAPIGYDLRFRVRFVQLVCFC